MEKYKVLHGGIQSLTMQGVYHAEQKDFILWLLGALVYIYMYNVVRKIALSA